MGEMFSFINNFNKLKQTFLFVLLFIYALFLVALVANDMVNVQGVFLIVVLFIITYMFFTNFFAIFSKNIDKHTKNVQQTLLENIPKGIMLTSKDGTIEYVNKYFETITLYKKEEVLGQKVNILKSGHHPQKFYEKLWNKVQNEGYFNGEIINRKKDGQIYHQRVSITAVFEQDRISSYIAIFSDISQEKEILQKLKNQKESLKKQAQTDYLTNIYNRNKFDNILEYECKKFERYKENFCLIFIDIDHFKQINDQFGHDVGDSVLVELSSVISQNIRTSDTFARWGGEEFVLLLSQTTLTHSKRIANKLRKLVEFFEFETVGNITVSMGLVEYDTTYSVEEFIKRADNALYKAKKNGRNRVEIDS